MAQKTTVTQSPSPGTPRKKPKIKLIQYVSSHAHESHTRRRERSHSQLLGHRTICGHLSVNPKVPGVPGMGLGTRPHWEASSAHT